MVTALVVLRVQYIVLDAVFTQKFCDLFGFFDGRRTDKDGLTRFVPRHDLFQNGALFALDGGIHHIGHILADDGLIGGNFQNVERIDGTELALLRLGGTRHARKFFV